MSDVESRPSFGHGGRVGPSHDIDQKTRTRKEILFEVSPRSIHLRLCHMIIVCRG